MPPESTLPTNPVDRKQRPMARGLLDYFPDALAEVAHVSYVGNQQHNPGEELHWDRSKSTDHADCIVRHLVERGKVDTDGLRHSAKAAWRSLALLQTEIEASRARPPLRLVQIIEAHQQQVDGEIVAALEHWEAERPVLHTPPVAEAVHVAVDKPSGRKVYIAGPMRGLPQYNFPAFDEARDRAKSLGWAPISPADMDRVAGVHEDTPNSNTSGPEAAREFARRDTQALLSLRAEDGDAIAMLPGWEKSTGALAEFFLARWLGLKILNARTFEPLHPAHVNWTEMTRAVDRTLCGQSS